MPHEIRFQSGFSEECVLTETHGGQLAHYIEATSTTYWECKVTATVDEPEGVRVNGSLSDELTLTPVYRHRRILRLRRKVNPEPVGQHSVTHLPAERRSSGPQTYVTAKVVWQVAGGGRVEPAFDVRVPFRVG